MMEKLNHEKPISKSRRQLLFLSVAAPVIASASSLLPAVALAAPDTITTRKVDDGCPLNSGGPTLLDSNWQVVSIYGNKIPRVVGMVMKVNQSSLTGASGCNTYAASFKQVGYTGFTVTNIAKTKKGCRILRPVKGGPTINVGSLEGGFLRTLRRMGSVQQFDNRLVFYNRSGKQGIVMHKM